MTPEERQLLTLLRQVRTCFNQLRSLAEQLHHDLGVTPSMRAVMEDLAARGQQTVPDIARLKGVSRQHVQTIMNALEAAGLVAASVNPAHKRSPLFNLTDAGSTTFAAIGEREAAPLQRLSAAVEPAALAQAEATLEYLNRKLAEEINRGDDDAAST